MKLFLQTLEEERQHNADLLSALKTLNARAAEMLEKIKEFCIATKEGGSETMLAQLVERVHTAYAQVREASEVLAKHKMMPLPGSEGEGEAMATDTAPQPTSEPNLTNDVVDALVGDKEGSPTNASECIIS